MTTSTSEASKKRVTNEELEDMIKAEINVTQLTCAQLCAERANDIDLLSDLYEFPVKLRAQVRASLIRDIGAISAQLKLKKCPACAE